MRCFLAIALPPAVRQHLASLQERLRRARASVSWPRAENLHLTLRFLGETSEEQATAVSDILVPALAACIRPQLAVRGVGAFPRLDRPSVIWTGVETPGAALAAIQAHCEEAARTAGSKAEKKPFAAHITLGRVRDQRRLRELVRCLRGEHDFSAGEFAPVAVTLFESDLTPGGALYTPLREFPLYAASDDPE
ncbi:MAG: RNA 2',3'-cyclic phosphodiesterase [Candidatus Hydrogenedentes bacterium]|nr:RNA 2',3'-cyclic phosphodiesterase [Candidatus Hydrogenedentota bacterium]